MLERNPPLRLNVDERVRFVNRLSLAKLEVAMSEFDLKTPVTENPEAEKIEELSDDDLEGVAGGWTGDDNGGNGGGTGGGGG